LTLGSGEGCSTKIFLKQKIVITIQEESLEIVDGVNMPKKVQVTFSNGQWKLIERLRGTIGDTDSEIIRNIVISYLSEKSYIKEEIFSKARNNLKSTSER
jgi:hypothetical protein